MENQALTDLKTEVATLTDSVSKEIGAAVTAITNAPRADDGSVAAADVETIVGSLKDLQTTVDAATAKFTPAPSTTGPDAGGSAQSTT